MRRTILFALGLAIALPMMASAATKPKLATVPNAPYVPTRGYVIKAFPPTDIPDHVATAGEHLVQAEWELGTTVDAMLFLGEIPGGSPYGWTPAQIDEGARFIASTDFTRQGISAVGTSSSLRYDPALANTVQTYFNNVLLGPARGGGSNDAHFDHRLRVSATPITRFRQGVVLIRTNRPPNMPPDLSPITGNFSGFDEGLRFRPFVGGGIRWIGRHRLIGAPMGGGVLFKTYRRTEFAINIDRKAKTISVGQTDSWTLPIGAYGYIAESMQPEDHGLYEGGLQIGADAWFVRFGYVNLNRFDRGTRVPDQTGAGFTGAVGRSIPLSERSKWRLDPTFEFGLPYYATVQDTKGSWFGSPGVTVTLGYDF